MLAICPWSVTHVLVTELLSSCTGQRGVRASCVRGFFVSGSRCRVTTAIARQNRTGDLAALWTLLAFGCDASRQHQWLRQRLPCVLGSFCLSFVFACWWPVCFFLCFRAVIASASLCCTSASEAFLLLEPRFALRSLILMISVTASSKAGSDWELFEWTSSSGFIRAGPGHQAMV